MKEHGMSSTVRPAATDRPEWTIGLDLGDRWSQDCVLDAGAQVVEKGRVATTGKGLSGLGGGRGRCRERRARNARERSVLYHARALPNGFPAALPNGFPIALARWLHPTRAPSHPASHCPATSAKTRKSGCTKRTETRPIAGATTPLPHPSRRQQCSRAPLNTPITPTPAPPRRQTAVSCGRRTKQTATTRRVVSETFAPDLVLFCERLNVRASMHPHPSCPVSQLHQAADES